MSLNLGQLRTKTYALIDEVEGGDTHFPDASVIAGYLNEAAEFAAVFIEYPRDLVSVQTEAGKPSYSNPEDNLILRTAYFGDRSIFGDVKPLKIVSEETLKTIYPSWLDQNSSARSDRPEYLIQLDRLTICVIPTPNAVGGASGKKIHLNYNYVPTAMSQDIDTPDVPVPYHNLLPLYAAHLCYLGRLNNEKMAATFIKSFMDKVNLLKSAVTKETKESLGFSWGYDDVNVGDSNGGIIP